MIERREKWIIRDISSESRRRLSASDFSAGDSEHVSLLTRMGIQIQTMTDGRRKSNLFRCFF